MQNTKFSKQELYLLIIVCVAMLLIPLTITSSSIFNIVIMKGFSISYHQAQWFINIYMVTYGASLAVCGALADYFGRKTLLLYGLIISMAGFLVGGLTSYYPLLLVCRAFCGLGAAALTTSATSLLAVNMAPEKKSTAFAIFGIALGTGMIAGPLLAAIMSGMEQGWRLFSALIATVFLLLSVCASRLREDFTRSHKKFDIAGSILMTIFLFAAVLLCSFLPVWGLKSINSGALLLVLLASGLFFVRVEKRVENPVLNMMVFRQPIFLAMSCTTLILGLGFISVLFYMPYILQTATDFTTLQIGVAITAATLPSLLFPPLIAKKRACLSNALLLKITLFLTILSPLVLGLVLMTTTPANYYIAMFILGSSFGISLSFLDGVAVNAVDASQSGLAAGTFNTFRIGGESVSIPLLTTLMALITRHTDGWVMNSPFTDEPLNSTLLSIIVTLVLVAFICLSGSVFVLKTWTHQQKRSVEA